MLKETPPGEKEKNGLECCCQEDCRNAKLLTAGSAGNHPKLTQGGNCKAPSQNKNSVWMALGLGRPAAKSLTPLTLQGPGLCLPPSPHMKGKATHPWQAAPLQDKLNSLKEKELSWHVSRRLHEFSLKNIPGLERVNKVVPRCRKFRNVQEFPIWNWDFLGSNKLYVNCIKSLASYWTGIDSMRFCCFTLLN